MANQAPAALGKEIEALARDNEKLKAENSQLKSELGHQQHAFGKGWRMIVIGFCVAAATAFLIVGNVLFWAGDTLINSDKYSQTISEVVKDSAVQKGVADYTTAKLFENVDVSGVIQNALPPKAGFLAAPLTSGVRQATNATLQHVLASDKFQTTFIDVNASAHDRFISAIKHSQSDGTINLQDAYNQLAQQLQGTKLSFLAGKSLPANIGEIKLVQADWLPKVRTVINNIGWIKPVSLFFVAVFSGIAIWLARNRRKVVIILGSFFAFGMLASLVSYRILKSVIVAHTAPAYQTAVEHAAHIILRPLAGQTATILTLSLLIVAVAWVSGPYRAAAVVRGRLRSLLAGQLHHAIFGKSETAFTQWIGRRKRLLEWLAVALVGIIMLVVTLSPGLIVKYAVLMVVLVLLIETLAAPYSQRPR